MFINILIGVVILVLLFDFVFLVIDFILIRAILRDFRKPAQTFVTGSKLISYLRLMSNRYVSPSRERIIRLGYYGVMVMLGVFLASNFYIELLFVIGFLVVSFFLYWNNGLMYSIDREFIDKDKSHKILIMNDIRMEE